MNLFRLTRIFQPLQNPAGFGVADFLVLGIALLFVGYFLLWPRLAPAVERLATNTRLSMIVLAALPIALRLALLPSQPVPAARVADDYSYLLLGDTLAHFRLANPQHPMHRFFEGVFTLQEPTWSSVYPLGQGLALALGQLLFGHPWAGVVLSCALLCALSYWMLRAWVAPLWALAGGLLAILQFGPLSSWMNLYWGGAVSAIAGCLVFGALPRLRDGGARRHAVILGVGLGLQMLSRPYEFVFIAIAVASYVAIWLRHRTVLIGITLLSLTPAGALTLLQNRQVTGSWTTLPYALSRDRYGVPTTFTFQTVPTARGPLTVEQKIDYDAQVTVHNTAPEAWSPWIGRLFRRAAFYRFYFLAPLFLAIPAFFFSLRDPCYAWIAATLLLLAAGCNFYPYFYPHYIAVATCLFLLISVKGLDNLTRFGGHHLTHLLLALCLTHFVFWYGLYAWGDANILRALDGYEGQYALAMGDPDGRLAIDARLAQTPGQHVVFVRYPEHYSGDPWIRNAADIDASHTVYALDLGDTENAALLRYYRSRTAWLLDADSRPARLTPYPVTAR